MCEDAKRFQPFEKNIKWNSTEHANLVQKKILGPWKQEIKFKGVSEAASMSFLVGNHCAARGSRPDVAGT